jgi:hypothetical protein
VAEVPAVAVPGPEEGDARLASIDLREQVVTTRFDFEFGESGTAAVDEHPFGAVLRWPLDPGRESVGWSFAPDFTGISLVPKGSYEVLVTCEGWQPQRATMVDGLVKATLRRWPEVVLRFPAHGSLPAGWSFVASLRAHEVLPRWQTEGDFELAASSGFDLRWVLLPDLDAVDAFDGSARVIIGNGPHALEVSLSDEEGNSVPLKDITPATIYAANGDVTVRLAEEELAAAIERLRR